MRRYLLPLQIICCLLLMSVSTVYAAHPGVKRLSDIPDAIRIQDAGLCRAAAVVVETQLKLPEQILSAISLTESGTRIYNPISKNYDTAPWPWTINVEGRGYYFPTKQDAIEKIKSLSKQGKRSIDVGCMQVNLYYHGTAFKSLDEALDPLINAAYAGYLLNSLYQNARNWMRAVGLYHSATPHHHQRYRKVVSNNWQLEKQRRQKIHKTLEKASLTENTFRYKLPQ